MSKFKCLRETGKRRLYAITDPKWNAALSEGADYPCEIDGPDHGRTILDSFAEWFENTYHESVTNIAHGKINNDQWYFKTFYLPIMEGE